ncbi:hypothetical protein AB0M43_38210 [Longispora sp. NPDC051575]|uniref:hypothetical protein n=1 Tax=Longispora sp. NPDC051575 TaxID=3154943 RepID=UPI003433AFAC
MTRITTPRVLGGAALLWVLALVVAIALPMSDRQTFEDQALAEQRALAIPASWGDSSTVRDVPSSGRHASITWYYPTQTGAAAVTDVAQLGDLAREQGWQVRNCGSETCMAKGGYHLMVDLVACDGDAQRCGLAVSISWTAPLIAGRLLGIVTVLLALAVGAYLAVVRSRARAASVPAGGDGQVVPAAGGDTL